LNVLALDIARIWKSKYVANIMTPYQRPQNRRPRIEIPNSTRDIMSSKNPFFQAQDGDVDAPVIRTLHLAHPHFDCPLQSVNTVSHLDEPIILPQHRVVVDASSRPESPGEFLKPASSMTFHHKIKDIGQKLKRTFEKGKRSDKNFVPKLIEL
jgi:hypothetical protein